MGDPTRDALRFETRAIHAGQEPDEPFGRRALIKEMILHAG